MPQAGPATAPPQPGLADIVLNAPWWVWPILAAIVALGLRATRRRRLNPFFLVVLPGAFAFVSLGVTFGRNLHHADVLIAWIGGFALGMGLGWGTSIGAHVYAEGEGVSVPGSWAILFVPLAFFALQFWFGFLRATQPGLLETLPYRLVAPFGGAMMTGFFSGRAAALFLLFRRAKADAG